MRVVFFGTPVFAVPSLEALIRSSHEVVAVVSQPDRPRGRGQQLQATPTKHVALTHGISVLQPAKIRDEAFLQQIRDLRADLGVVVAFGIAGDVKTGVTIMRVERELDAGPTFAVATMPIPPDATSGDMEAVLATLGAQLLLPVVDDLALGRAVETPQDHSRATHAPKITKDEGVIDWNQPADAIHNLVRGLQPWPLASTHLNGARIVLRRTLGVRSANRPNPGVRSADRPDTGARARDSALAPGKGRSADLTPGRPGTVVHAAGDELIVACGGGTLLQILELQPEGRRTMTARDFLAGHGVTEGARFTS